MKRKNLTSKPMKSPQIPVTVEMLNEMEGHLSYKIDSGLHRVRSELTDLIESKVVELKSEISGVKSEISGIKSEISGMKTEIFGVKSELHRVALLVEEQNARNKFVLDGYAQLYELIERKLG